MRAGRRAVHHRHPPGLRGRRERRVSTLDWARQPRYDTDENSLFSGLQGIFGT
jgi:hypothetical protein